MFKIAEFMRPDAQSERFKDFDVKKMGNKIQVIAKQGAQPFFIDALHKAMHVEGVEDSANFTVRFNDSDRTLNIKSDASRDLWEGEGALRTPARFPENAYFEFSDGAQGGAQQNVA